MDQRQQMEQAMQQQQMAQQMQAQQMPQEAPEEPVRDEKTIRAIQKKHPNLEKITPEQFAIFVEGGENPDDLGLTEEEYQAYSEAGGFADLYKEIGM